MTATSGWRKPTNRSYQGEAVIEWHIVGANATAAKMLPGALVDKDTRDGNVMENDGSGNPYGFIAYDTAWTGDDMPDTISDYYTVGSRVPVITRCNGRVMARLAASQTIVKGALLKQSTTDSYLDAATAGTDDVIAVAAEAVTTSSEQGGTAIWVYMR